MDFCVMLVTVPNAALGGKIAQVLVEEKLAACVNRVLGLTSVFTWQGKVEKAGEELLIIKTRQALMDSVIKKVSSLHEYEVPEIIALPILGGNQAYLEWMEKETRML